MKYMVLIYDSEALWAGMTEQERGAMFAAYGAFQQEVEAAGVFAEGDPLQPTATATTVRVREGKALVTDGPFAETKEQLAGYYVLNCQNLDEALEWAAKIPSAKIGSIEVRPIMAM